MWRDALRDLQWRRLRFAIAVVATSLVFAVTLLMGGLVRAFRLETRQTVAAFGIDAWVVKKGSLGPFTGVSVVPDAYAQQLRRTPGVRDAGSLAITPMTVYVPRLATTQLVGFEPGHVGTPHVADGRTVRRAGEIVVDDRLDATVGSKVRFAGRRFTVVGRTHGLTLFSGQPNVYVSMDDFQRAVFGGFNVASAIGVRGRPSRLPAGLHALTAAELETDMLRQMENAIGSIALVRVILWLVATAIVAAVVYLSALERTRDFAVYKATGASSATLFGGLALQATALSCVSALLATGFAKLLEPAFPMAVSVTMASRALLLAVAVAIGAAASAFAVRRASRVDPALAFGGP